MLTGRRAFRGETEVDTITAVLREDPPEINLEKASVPVSFQQIVRHCLEKEPENRFQSARDLAFALETLSRRFRRHNPVPGSLLRATIVPWAVAGVLMVATLLLLLGKRWQQNIQLSVVPASDLRKRHNILGALCPRLSLDCVRGSMERKATAAFHDRRGFSVSAAAQCHRCKIAGGFPYGGAVGGASRRAHGTPGNRRRYACPRTSCGRLSA